MFDSPKIAFNFFKEFVDAAERVAGVPPTEEELRFFFYPSSYLNIALSPSFLASVKLNASPYLLKNNFSDYFVRELNKNVYLVFGRIYYHYLTERCSSSIPVSLSSTIQFNVMCLLDAEVKEEEYNAFSFF